jgi:hypothetical protein
MLAPYPVQVVRRLRGRIRMRPAFYQSRARAIAWERKRLSASSFDRHDVLGELVLVDSDRQFLCAGGGDKASYCGESKKRSLGGESRAISLFGISFIAMSIS